MQTMTSRERLLAALSHKQPDRIPLDLGGTRNSTMVMEGYERLKAHLGGAAPSKMIERMMRVVEIDEGICRTLAIDTRGVFPGGATRGLAADLAHDLADASGDFFAGDACHCAVLDFRHPSADFLFPRFFGGRRYPVQIRSQAIHQFGNPLPRPVADFLDDSIQGRWHVLNHTLTGDSTQ